MAWLEKFLKNDVFWITLFTGFFAQALKFILRWIKEGKPNIEWLFTTGGMPSAHSASVMCLTTMIGKKAGTDSLLFAITFYFSLIIMYDAAGLRRAAGEQAKVLNKLIQEISQDKKLEIKRLKEFLGHTPTEVLVGGTIGIVIGLLFG